MCVSVFVRDPACKCSTSMAYHGLGGHVQSACASSTRVTVEPIAAVEALESLRCSNSVAMDPYCACALDLFRFASVVFPVY